MGLLYRDNSPGQDRWTFVCTQMIDCSYMHCVVLFNKLLSTAVDPLRNIVTNCTHFDLMNTTDISPADFVRLLPVWCLDERTILVVTMEGPFACAYSPLSKETFTATHKHTEMPLVWTDSMPHMLFDFDFVMTHTINVTRYLVSWRHILVW